MTKTEFNKLFLENEEGAFIPEYTCDDYIYNKRLGDYEYVNFKIIKTASEVYAEQLESKDKEPSKTKICLTQEQRAIQDLSIELAKLKLKLQLLNK